MINLCCNLNINIFLQYINYESNSNNSIVVGIQNDNEKNKPT